MNDLKYFISTNFKGCVATNKREIPFEQCVTILNKDGVMIEFYEKDNLLQIFGLTENYNVMMNGCALNNNKYISTLYTTDTC